RVRVVEMLEAIVKAQPGPDRRADLASGLERLARAYRAAGRTADAADAYGRAIYHRDQGLRATPGDPDPADAPVDAANNLGLTLEDLHKNADAEAAYRRGIEAGDRLTARHPTRVESRITLAGTYCNLGHLIRGQGKPADALPLYT